jgi:ABC-type spermidine/putrescine transport system permease subunit I
MEYVSSCLHGRDDDCTRELNTWTALLLCLLFRGIFSGAAACFGLAPLGRYYLPQYLGSKSSGQVSRNG